MESKAASPIEVLRRYRTIAVVGASRNPEKEAHTVPRYLKENGYTIVPVNPTAERILGERVYPTLLHIPDEVAREVEVVEVFRPSEELARVARQVIEMRMRCGRPFVFWAQEGLESEEAKEVLESNDVQYVMNSCMRTVHSIWVRAGGGRARDGRS